ncbi:MAG: hypothetical protein ACJAWL_002605 [Motiliproteus sp.]|jgi:hypothetical protein
MGFQLKAVVSDQVFFVALDEPLSVIPANKSAIYTLVDSKGEPVIEDLVLRRKGDDLEIDVDGKTVVSIDDFYATEGPVTYSVEGALNPAEEMAVQGGPSAVDDGIVWQASETDAQGFGMGAVLLGAGAAGAAAYAVGAYNDDGAETDTTAPVVESVTLADSVLKAGETTTLTLVFSEAVKAFDETDISLDNGTLTGLSSSDSITWTGTFTPAIDIEETANIISVGTALIDLAGNSPENGADSANYAIDTLPPTASLYPPTQIPMVQLEAPGNTTGIDRDPQIADVGTDGEYAVTWQGEDAGGDYGVYVQRFNADGTTAGSASQVESINNKPAQGFDPKVTAVGTAGAYVVSWAANDADNDSDYVYVQGFNAAGSPDGSVVRLETQGYSPGPISDFQISALGTDGGYVVTLEATGGIYVQRYDVAGSPDGSAFKQDTPGFDQDPQITALGTAGAYVVTWQGEDGAGNESIYVQAFDTAGNPKGSAVKLDVSSNWDTVDHLPQITELGTDGSYVVTWLSNCFGFESTYVQRFNADGTTNGSAVDLGMAPSNRGPQITDVGTSGAFVVARQTWEYYGDPLPGKYPNASILVQSVDAAGNLNGSAVQLDAPGSTSGGDKHPQVTSVGTDGAYVVTWYGEDAAGDYSIYVQRFGAAGTTQGVTVQLESIGSSYYIVTYPQITGIGTGGAYAVTWVSKDAEGDYSISVQLFNANGTTNGQTVFQSTDSINAQSSEVGNAYLVHSSVAVTTLADITSAADGLWNDVSITAADTNASLGATGLDDGEYVLYSVDEAGNLSTPSASSITIDNTGPTLTSSTPDDNATGVARAADLVLTFNEDIALGTGTIVITDGTDRLVIDVADHDDQLNVSGKKLTIDPTNDLQNVSADYHVEIGGDAVTDTARNAYAGIADDDSSTLNFVTGATRTSIVVFDFVHGVSSSHNGGGGAVRTFEADTDYTIYIMVDSRSSTLHWKPHDGAAADAVYRGWMGVEELGSGDKVVLVGNGSEIIGRNGAPVTRYTSGGGGGPYLNWLTSEGSAAVRVNASGLVRRDNANRFDYATVAGTRTGDGVWQWGMGTGTDLYANTIPEGILTSQGLVMP